MPAEQKLWISSILEPLSVLALLLKIGEVSDDYPTWALWVVGLPGLASIFERSVFRALQVILTLILAWIALRIGSWMVAGYAAGWGLLSLLVFAEDDARRMGQGNFLAAIWWSAQAYLHSSDVRAAGWLETWECLDSNPLAVIFTLASLYMIAHELTVGLWKLRPQAVQSSIR